MEKKEKKRERSKYKHLNILRTKRGLDEIKNIFESL